MKITDDLGRIVEFNKIPERIISFVPSITELLFDLGVGEQIIGKTDFCVHPKDKTQNLISVGGTKNVNLNTVRALKPDLLIAIKEENSKGQVEALAQEFPCLVFDVTNFDSAIHMMRQISKVLDKSSLVEELILDIHKEKDCLSKKDKKKAVYLIWHKPMMSVNSETYISEMLALAGFDNVFNNKQDSYPVIEKKDLIEEGPEYILLSTEPFPFKEKHVELYQKEFPNSKVIIVDGEMFSWYGTRMIKAFKYFSNNF